MTWPSGPANSGVGGGVVGGLARYASKAVRLVGRVLEPGAVVHVVVLPPGGDADLVVREVLVVQREGELRAGLRRRVQPDVSVEAVALVPEALHLHPRAARRHRGELCTLWHPGAPGAPLVPDREDDVAP